MLTKNKKFLFAGIMLILCFILAWAQDPEYKELNPFSGQLDATRSDVGINGQWLRVDLTNDPGTGDFEILKATPEIKITDIGDSNSARWLRSDTSSQMNLYNTVWVTGIQATREVSIIQSEDSLVSGIYGIQTFGDSNGKTVIDGSTIHFNISDFEYWNIDTLGNLLPSSVNTWTERQPAGDADKNWYIVASDDDGSNLMAGSSDGIGRLYTSSDFGATWTERQPKGDVNGQWIGIATDADGSNLIAGDYVGRLYTSSDYGANWTERRPKGDANGVWWAVDSDSDGSHLIATEYPGRIYTSDDSGATWTERQPAGDTDKNWSGTSSDSDGSNLAVTGQPGRVYTSSNYGVAWTERQPAGAVDKDWWDIDSDSDGSNLIIASAAFATQGRLYTSADYGASWIERQPAGDADQFWGGMGSDADGSHLVVCIYGDRVYASDNYGVTWTEQRPVGDVNSNWQWTAIDSDGSHLIACILPGRIYTTNVLIVPDIGSDTYGVKNIFVDNTATLNNAVIDTAVIDSTITVPNIGLHILDTDASHDLVIKAGSNLSADRTLTLTTGDSDRTITLTGNPTLDDWFDQSVKTTASPTFTGLDLSEGNITNVGDISLDSISADDGTNILVKHKLAFTQTDFNEYIDSLADGYLDYSVTTAHRFNMSTVDTDVRVEFIGTTNSGILTWMEDEDYFKFSDDILNDTSEKHYFRDLAIGIYSQADTYLDIFADGGVRIGDSSGGAPTNYLDIKPDGEINLVGTARVKEHIHLPLDTFLPGSQSPTEATIGHYSGYTYSQAVTQTATVVWHVPVDWDSTTDMVIHLHWAPTDAAAGDVVWDIDYKATASESNEILTGVQRSLSTTDSTQTLQYEHLQTADMTIPASDLEVLDMVGICLSRDTADAADTYGAGAFAFFLEIIYIKDKLGESL